MAQFFHVQKSLLSPDEHDYSEVARYLGYQKITVPDEQVQQLIKTATAELLEIITPQGVYDFFPVTVEYDEAAGKGSVRFADVTIASKDLARNLRNCDGVYIFACTLGLATDTFIRRTQHTDSVKAAVLQAAGAMFIEKFVDFLNQKIKEEAQAAGKNTRPRFSPGFGDVDLAVQKDFFRLLPCTRIGLTLMDTLIMSPEKSVTAFVGQL